ncbi:WD repeat-containing protein WRAP73 isoform X3 [Artibeus jamaicensis]|uniref:WD repeat-containing protein WRAP73 isoform X3 n=1 Tax=Artibeus jamaicensis TaxID=9417 RepID=UPI00235B2243|nr:WD repeat-containing protein WRAP73 isoform X3 [Artibeus jamaicensis]XP_037002848.2 WD repeat-containing protein WRAP73 isoform X3 [Artibeus jamaicensis]
MPAASRSFSCTPAWTRSNTSSGRPTPCSSCAPCTNGGWYRCGPWSSRSGTAGSTRAPRGWWPPAGAPTGATSSTPPSSTNRVAQGISAELRMTVWSLCTKSVSYIKYPKACQQGITFSRDGRYLALAERRDCKDYVSIFVCSDWQLLRHFDTGTQDLAGIEWAPNGCVLAAWDTCLEYKVLLYSLDGRLLAAYCAYEWSLGVKAVAWSPSSQFLAVGSYDGKVRILNHVTWKVLAELGHPASVGDARVVVYKEAEKSPRGSLGHPACPAPRPTESRYEIAEVPVSLQTLKPAADRANPKIGISALAFSPDSCFLATRNDNVPNAVWIWDVRKLRLFVVLEQLGPVRAFQWDPQQPRLAICTGGSKMYLWSPAGCVSVQVPGEGDFQVLSLCWHSNGDSLALLSKDHFCLCFLETEDGDGPALGRPGSLT